MTASRGTTLMVIDTDGDRYVHRRSNWYWVLLPRDAWGAQRGGWINGRDVEYMPAPEPPKPMPSADNQFVRMSSPGQPASQPNTIAGAGESSRMPAPVASAARSASPDPMESKASAAPSSAPAVSEVILNFAFDRSNLSDEAKAKLGSAVALLKNGNGISVSFSLEGHADWTGSESYNDKLGLARAETVRRHLAEVHSIPADKITVISFGESKPAASNDTRDGRAQNRRVVVKVGS
jgi:outer membrane protein OmpA-like peptidoglycan-associated protein